MMINLYDMNKEVLKSMPPINSIVLRQKINEIKNFMLEQKNRYFMLLNRETYNFTLLDFGSLEKEESDVKRIIKGFKECLEIRGEVIAIAKEDMSSYEIWIRNEEDQILVYYLFPYDIGVIN